MLPSRIDRVLTIEETRHLLMHELAHLARRDDWHQMVHQLVGVVCWWHPLIRWVIAKLEAEGEFACDEIVAGRTGRRPYARTLVRMAGLALERASALAPAASRGQLSERVESLVGGAAPVRPGWRGPVAGVALGSVTAAGIWLGPPVIGVRAGAPPLATAPPAQALPPGVIGDELDQIFTRFADSGFSGTILVAVGDRIVLEKGYGLADRERQIPATAATRYSTAGITKLFTAAAILTLEEEGRLAVADSLSRWTGRLPGAKQGVTLHQLLTHSDGLTRLQAPVYRRSADDFVAAVSASPAAFAPGTGYRYNDFGHSLLGLVVERASGERYEDFIRRRFLEPAGMAATGFEGEPGPMAVEYAGPAGRLVPIPERAYLWGRRGSLGMVSTASDLYQWFRAMNDPRVLSPRVRKRMLTPMGQSDWGAEQGYGWDFQPRPGGHRLWRRVAGTPGFEGELLHDPVAGWTAVILVNSRLGWRFRVWEAIERTIHFHGAVR
jgi:CubicO group peptidase (beta-lactamase class C family)